jgi:hypothetical protein
MSAHKIDFYLGTSTQLRTLAAEVRQLTELQRVIRTSLPSALAQTCRVSALRGDILFLLAENGAVAAKLKQLTPRLLTSFQKQQVKITGIQIRVQVEGAWPPLPPKPEKTPLSIESIEHLEKLAENLEDSPLKDAVVRLSKNQRIKSS